jgi:hypothetical protein
MVTPLFFTQALHVNVSALLLDEGVLEKKSPLFKRAELLISNG